LSDAEFFLIGPGDIGSVFDGPVGVEAVPGQARGLSILLDLSHGLFVAAFAFALDLLRVEGLVGRGVESGFDGGAGACRVLRFVFADFVSVEVVVKIGSFWRGERTFSGNNFSAREALNAGPSTARSLSVALRSG
jgi:hypothetical protein